MSREPGAGGSLTADHEPDPVACFPELAGHPVRRIQEGWDSEVYVLAGQIVRIPRRSETRARARAEVRLLRLLTDALPVRVPDPLGFCDAHGSLRYLRIDGAPATSPRFTVAPDDALVDQVSAFLTALRRFPADRARGSGILDLAGAGWKAHYLEVARRFSTDVVPQLPPEHRLAADDLLASVDLLPDAIPDSVVHADLGPSHLLCDERGLRGVIDWGDACLGDPAIDLAWLLNATPPEFVSALGDRLDLDDAEVERATLYHRLGPWYEVEHGLRIGDVGFVTSGVRGILERLPS